MASKAAQQTDDQKIDVEEALDVVDKTLERIKSLYEQYFLGIQKQAPTFLHTDLERKLRDLGQIQIRNTAIRYRLVTLQQKFGSYNAYWRRTIRQIENGTYGRSLHKLGRKAVQTGEEIPEEILAAMPKRMRDQVRRDREAALALARQRKQIGATSGQGDFYDEFDDAPAQPRVDARGAHLLDEGDADLDLDAYFRQVEEEVEHTSSSPRPPQPPPVADSTEDDQFENIHTPPRATPTPPSPTPPSQPAPLRASTLGFGPRPTTSPNMRVPNRTATDPGAPTPPPFAPVGSGNTPQPFRPPAAPPVGSRPAFRAVDTVPGTGPSRGATQPDAAAPPSHSQPMTEPDQRVVGARPLGKLPVDPRAIAPSQVTRPNPIAAGAAAQAKPASVETMQGPFAREPSTHVPPRRAKRDTDVDQNGVDVPMEPTPRPMEPVKPPGLPTRVPNIPAIRSTPTPASVTQGAKRPVAPAPAPTPRPSQAAARTATTPGQAPVRPSQTAAQKPPPGMTDDDVNTLYAKYVKAKEMVGEATGPQTYGKLLNTINSQAPKIMEQYKAKGVDFSVVVKDNQVIIRAKPKT